MMNLILLRPDHVVAWRGTGLSEARNALRTILRPTGPGLRLGILDDAGGRSAD
jgi:hypothetical protein